MFSAYKSVIVSPCACDLFVSTVTKITRYMDVRSFLAVIFSLALLSVCEDCILKSTTAWLLKLAVLYIHSFMQVHNTTFQIKTVFNNVYFQVKCITPCMLTFWHYHAESNHRDFTSKQCQSLTFYPRKESPHSYQSGRGSGLVSSDGTGCERSKVNRIPRITERRKWTPKIEQVAGKMAGNTSNDE